MFFEPLYVILKVRKRTREEGVSQRVIVCTPFNWKYFFTQSFSTNQEIMTFLEAAVIRGNVLITYLIPKTLVYYGTYKCWRLCIRGRVKGPKIKTPN